MEWLLALSPLLLAVVLLLWRASALQSHPLLPPLPQLPPAPHTQRGEGGSGRGADRGSGAAQPQPPGVLLVTAHPDDECMFFSPTVLSLTRAGRPVHVLCLSNGNAHGHGRVREKELQAACAALGVPSERVTVIDDPQLRDGMKEVWPPDVVADHVAKAVGAASPALIVTFDSHGVSGHANHTAVYHGVLQYKQQLTATPHAEPPEFLMLESTNLVRKFAGLLDLPLSALTLPRAGGRLVVSPSSGAGMAAMLQHQSQLVWYRFAFIIMSRYSVINTLRRLQ